MSTAAKALTAAMTKADHVPPFLGYDPADRAPGRGSDADRGRKPSEALGDCLDVQVDEQ
jgi:hypothetical protein